MKLCIPITQPHGIHSKISDHFGRAPHHIIVETDTMDHMVLDKGKTRAQGHCLPVQLLLSHGVDTVLCRGMGRGAFSTFVAHGIQVRAVHQTTVAEALAAYQAGTLADFGEAQLCEGHSHSHG